MKTKILGATFSLVCFVSMRGASPSIPHPISGYGAVTKSPWAQPPIPDFAASNLTFELRNLRGDYEGTIPPPAGPMTYVEEDVWIDGRSRGYSENTLYGNNNSWSSGTRWDWRGEPTAFYFSDGNLTGSEPLALFTTNFIMRAEHANVMVDDPMLWGQSYTWKHVTDYYATPTNSDAYRYAYRLTPVFSPHEWGGPLDSVTFLPAAQDPATFTVAGYTANKDGNVYLPMNSWDAADITPRSRVLPWYRFSILADKVQVVGPYLIASGVISPSSVTYPGRIKDTPLGIGYDPGILESIIADAGTQWCGKLVTNSAGYLRLLSYLQLQVPVAQEFQTGWSWRQDVSTRTDVYDPLIYNWRVIPWTLRRYAGYCPPSSGNDPQEASDVTPDLARTIYNADAPGFMLDTPDLAFFNKGAILKWSFAARTWPAWKGCIVTNYQRWRFSIVLRKISDRDTRPSTWQILFVIPVHYGDAPEPLSLSDGQLYYR